MVNLSLKNMLPMKPSSQISPLVIGCLLLFVSCNHPSEKAGINGVVKIKKIVFSNPTEEDTFKIEAIGTKSENIRLVFTITSFENKPLFKLTIIASELLKNYLGSENLDTENEKLNFIKEELNTFFSDENFLEPAVMNHEKPDKYTPDISFYNELKQTKLSGFSYRLGKETKVYIAWSVSTRQVKTYYKCC